MSKQTIFITGATDGVGKLVALSLAKQNKDATIIIHGRNKQKLQEILNEIKKKTNNNNIDGFVADFSALEDVRRVGTRCIFQNIIRSIFLSIMQGQVLPLRVMEKMEPKQE